MISRCGKILEAPSNNTLEDCLLTERNLLNLELVLAELKQSFRKPKPRDSSLPTKAMIEGALETSISDVNEFLGVYDVPSPRLHILSLKNPTTTTAFIGLSALALAGVNFYFFASYGSYQRDFITLGIMALLGGSSVWIAMGSPHYERGAKRIVASRGMLGKEGVAPSIAHEYAHHITCSKYSNPSPKIYGGFQEGFSLGIERHFAHQDQGNTRTLRYYRLLNSAYRWMCKRMHVSPNTDVSEAGVINRLLNKIHKRRHLGPYALGIAAFSLAEIYYGPGLYRDVIHGKAKIENMLT